MHDDCSVRAQCFDWDQRVSWSSILLPRPRKGSSSARWFRSFQRRIAAQKAVCAPKGPSLSSLALTDDVGSFETFESIHARFPNGVRRSRRREHGTNEFFPYPKREHFRSYGHQIPSPNIIFVVTKEHYFPTKSRLVQLRRDFPNHNKSICVSRRQKNPAWRANGTFCICQNFCSTCIERAYWVVVGLFN